MISEYYKPLGDNASLTGASDLISRTYTLLRDKAGRFHCYLLQVTWSVKADARGCLRAYRVNGWVRGQGISLSELSGSPPDDEDRLRRLLADRLAYCLGLRSLLNRPIFRYQLVQYCYHCYGWQYPRDEEGYLYDCHHRNGITTDDRLSNLELLPRSDHYQEHLRLGDSGFIPYQTLQGYQR